MTSNDRYAVPLGDVWNDQGGGSGGPGRRGDDGGGQVGLHGPPAGGSVGLRGH